MSGKKSSSLGAFDILVQLYNHQLTPTANLAGTNVNGKTELEPPPHSATLDADTADTLFLRGHLAVLFGLLMRRNPANQDYLLNALAGASSRATLVTLVEQAREFVAFYDALRGETEREGRVAKDVVAFLQELRDRS